jgi:hypothetical protein
MLKTSEVMTRDVFTLAASTLVGVLSRSGLADPSSRAAAADMDLSMNGTRGTRADSAFAPI